MMSRYALPVPEVPLQCIDDPRGLRVVRRLGSVTRYSVIGPRERIAALRTTPADTLRNDEGSHWRPAENESGIPAVPPETRHPFVPQMANKTGSQSCRERM